MATLIVVYELNEKDYPELLKLEPDRIQYFVEEGSLQLGSVYDLLDIHEQCIFNPVTVTIVK